MRTHPIISTSVVALGLVLFAPLELRAHCDALDGPVVTAAQRALETQNPALVLIWVAAKNEPEIRAAFERTLAVRALSPEAKDLADRFFFETVVRLHRAAEGEPFTGLKPAGRDLGPAIPAADKALDEGSVEPLLKLLTDAMTDRLLETFHRAIAAKRFKPNDVVAGREYVHSYLEFIQYVERLYELSAGASQGHVDGIPPGPLLVP